MTNTLPPTNFVNVSLSSTPQGLGEADVNSLLLLSTETPDNLDPYGIYLNPSVVATDYGSSSATYAMANAIFSQTPNILSGGGRLVIAPMIDAVSATSGNFVTANISANLSSLIAVVDGDLKVTIDSNAINLTGLNFTNCTTLANIATVLQSKLTNAIVTASATQITILSKSVGTTSTIALAAVSGGSGTDLTGSGLLNTSAGTATDGENSEGETIVDANLRLTDQVSYKGIITNLEIEKAVLYTTATAIQALDKIFIHSISSTADFAAIKTNISDAELTKTRVLFYSTSLATARNMRAAYAGRGFSVNYQGSATVQTMHGKSLTGITADPIITQTILTNAKDSGIDIYASFGGLAKLFTSGVNAYFDEVYNDLWLKLALETAGFNALTQLNTKLPQTESGMLILFGAYLKVLAQSVVNGMTGVGLTWSGGDRFGNLEDFDRNITDFGYYGYYIPVAQQSQADREAREAPVVQIAVKRAGAIHSSDVIVVIQR